jgi:hypothetical protein
VLRFERDVVAALTVTDDPRLRAGVERWVTDVLADMPEPLRLGVLGESVAIGAYAAARRRGAGALLDALDRSPIGLLRQYPRLFRSLVLFAELEL